MGSCIFSEARWEENTSLYKTGGYAQIGFSMSGHFYLPSMHICKVYIGELLLFLKIAPLEEQQCQLRFLFLLSVYFLYCIYIC